MVDVSEEFVRLEGKDYVKNFFRFKLYDEKKKVYLISVDSGKFIFANSSAFKQLRSGKIVDESVFKAFLSIGVILSPENITKVLKDFKKRFSFLENGTSLHIVIPTSRCNLNCSYCFAEPNRIDEVTGSSELDERTAKKIVDFIMSSPSSACTIEFQGGEALANFEMVKFITNYAKELNVSIRKDLRFTIVTNLTLMNDEMAVWFVENGVTICTSLDGPKFIHDKNRKILLKDGVSVGSYDKVVYWIERINGFYSERGIDLRVNALPTITRFSLPYFREIIDEFLKFDLKVVSIRSLTQVGKILKREDLIYDFSEFDEFYENCLNYLEELKEKGIFVSEQMRELYFAKIRKNSPGFHTDFESPCGATTGQLTYHSDGKIYTCHEGLGREEFMIGDVFSDDWRGVFKSPETQKAILNSMIEQNVICDRCVYKPYCSTCMVENFYKFGKFNFYPSKTQRHFLTIAQAEKEFDKVYSKLNV